MRLSSRSCSISPATHRPSRWLLVRRTGPMTHLVFLRKNHQQSQSSGCDPWRLGLRCPNVTSTHVLGDVSHQVLELCDSWNIVLVCEHLSFSRDTRFAARSTRRGSVSPSAPDGLPFASLAGTHEQIPLEALCWSGDWSLKGREKSIVRCGIPVARPVCHETFTGFHTRNTVFCWESPVYDALWGPG